MMCVQSLTPGECFVYIFSALVENLQTYERCDVETRNLASIHREDMSGRYTLHLYILWNLY